MDKKSNIKSTTTKNKETQNIWVAAKRYIKKTWLDYSGGGLRPVVETDRGLNSSIEHSLCNWSEVSSSLSQSAHLENNT